MQRLHRRCLSIVHVWVQAHATGVSISTCKKISAEVKDGEWLVLEHSTRQVHQFKNTSSTFNSRIHQLRSEADYNFNLHVKFARVDCILSLFSRESVDFRLA